MNGVAYIDQNGTRYSSMKLAPICAQSCEVCKMNKVAAAHGKSIYIDCVKSTTGEIYTNTRGMNCANFCDLYPDEVAETFGYKKVDVVIDIAETGVYTTDGYFFKELHMIPNTVNDMYIYEIYGEKFHKYLLSYKHQAKYIISHPLSTILSHLMPQHYECIVDTELEAIQIAKAVAMKSVVEFAKTQVKTAMEALEKIEEESKRVLGSTLKVDSIINNFWDNQVAISKSFRD